MKNAVPSALVGLWKRASLSVAGGPPFEDADVYWLQGGSYFVDLRIPIALGQEMSFAGKCDVDGESIRFRHDIDLLGLTTADEATIAWRDSDTLVERGAIDMGTGPIAFEEVWERHSVAHAGARSWIAAQAADRPITGVAIRIETFFAIACDGRGTGGAYRAALYQCEDGRWSRLAKIDAGGQSWPDQIDEPTPTALGCAMIWQATPI